MRPGQEALLSLCFCCCLLLPAAACCCLLLPDAACCLLMLPPACFRCADAALCEAGDAMSEHKANCAKACWDLVWSLAATRRAEEEEEEDERAEFELHDEQAEREEL